MSPPDDQPGHAASMAARATAREWAGLALLVLPMLTLSTDLTVLFFALPTLSADLTPTASQALWITHVYGFLIAGLLVTMGRLGDRIGPRRLMLVGAAAFAACSILAAFAVSAEMLILARGMLGISGATLMPSLFSLLRTMFRDDTQRRLAIAIMFSAFSVGGAIGPLLGGALLEWFWWGSVFLINVPPLVLLVLAGPRLLPERTERTPASLDLVSVIQSLLGMLAVVYGLQELAAGQETGGGSIWSNLAIAALGICLLWVFFRRQRRIQNPLFDLMLLADRRITTSLVTLLLVGIGAVGLFYLFTQYLQWVVGLSPLQAGLWTLPYIGANIAGAMLAPGMATRVRPVTIIASSLALASIGAVLLLAVADPGTPVGLLAAVFTLVAFGQGAAMALVSDLVISSAPTEQTGSAAAAQEVGGELGTALGIAAGGAVGMFVYRMSLSDGMSAEVSAADVSAARSSIHEGMATARELSSEAPALLDAVNDAVTGGLQAYAGVAATFLATGAALVGIVLASRRGQVST